MNEKIQGRLNRRIIIYEDVMCQFDERRQLWRYVYPK